MFGFESRIVSELTQFERKEVEALLARFGLIYEGTPDRTALVEDTDEHIVATASIEGDVVKMVAADPQWQEAGLAGTVISRILEYASGNKIFHLFVYTKPDMAEKFASLGFRELAKTASVVLMESGRPSASDFRESIEKERFTSGAGFGAIVMNCNPFTLGHRYLIETAAKQCGGLYVIVVREDSSAFPFEDRLELVRKGTEGIPGVKILSSGGYAVSRATFPTYFLKDRGADAVSATQSELDVTLFADLFVPALGVTKRFVGTEPFCATTAIYNEKMKAVLPLRGVEVIEIPRITDAGGEFISASRVRAAIAADDTETLRKLLPQSTLDYLASEAGRAVVQKLRDKK